MLTIAYIANGKSTNRYHIPFATKIEGIKIKTIYDRSMNGAWPEIEGVYYTSDLDELLNDPEIDLVVICTPAGYHYDYAKMVLEHGKNALVEKPFADTSQQARELFQLAKDKGLFIQCYQNRRFDSDFLTVQKVIESGKLGEVFEVVMHFDYYRPEIPLNTLNYDEPSSFVYSHACHTVDQVLSYFGNPPEIYYDVRQLLGTGRMNDYFDLDFNYPTYKVSIKSSYFIAKARPSFVVYGRQGTFVKETKDRQEEHLKMFYMPTNADFGVDLPEHYGTLTYYDDNGRFHEEKVISEVGDYSRIYQGVYDSIINSSDKIVKDEETIRQLEILEEAVKGLY